MHKRFTAVQRVGAVSSNFDRHRTVNTRGGSDLLARNRRRPHKVVEEIVEARPQGNHAHQAKIPAGDFYEKKTQDTMQL